MDQARMWLSRRDTLAGGLGLTLLGGCSPSIATNTPPPPPAPPAPDPSNLHLPAVGAPEQALGGAIAEFGVAMLAQLMAASTQATLVVSPVSAMAGMLMLGQGARGATADAIGQAMRLSSRGLSLGAAAQAFANLAARLVSSSAATVAIANGLWADSRAGLQPQFAAALKTTFGAQATVADLSSPSVLNDINRFVSDTTYGKIPTIIDQPLTSAAMLVLIDALYFKGAWQTPFDAHATQPAPFTHADGSTAPSQLMGRYGEFVYSETDSLQVVDLPYKDGRFDLRLVLQKPGAPAGAWSAGFFAAGDAREGSVLLPRLSLSWGAELTALLAQLGMAPAFAPNADYSGAMTAPFGSLLVEQKCILNVDETGAEAAAATAIVMLAGSAAPSPNTPPPFVFRADRPFHAALIEKATGAPLILTYVATPG